MNHKMRQFFLYKLLITRKLRSEFKRQQITSGNNLIHKCQYNHNCYYDE